MQEQLCNRDLLGLFQFFSPSVADEECAFKKLQTNAWTRGKCLPTTNKTSLISKLPECYYKALVQLAQLPRIELFIAMVTHARNIILHNRCKQRSFHNGIKIRVLEAIKGNYKIVQKSKLCRASSAAFLTPGGFQSPLGRAEPLPDSARCKVGGCPREAGPEPWCLH